jgi:hypothetical protein
MLPRMVNQGALRNVGVNEWLVDEVRRRVLSAPPVRAWMYAIAELREGAAAAERTADPADGRAAIEYWRALTVVSHDFLEGLLLERELDQILSRFSAPGRPAGFFFNPPVPMHVVDKAGTRQRRRSETTVELAAWAYISRFEIAPTTVERLDRQLEAIIAGRHAEMPAAYVGAAIAYSDATAEEHVLSEGDQRDGRRAKEARQVVLDAHQWRTWGLLRPGPRRPAA